MKIAILGITGRVGSRLATELLKRGHRITGIARDTRGASVQSGLTVLAGDAMQFDVVAPLLSGHDVVISATRFDGGPDATTVIHLAKQACVQRLLVVGGAGSLEVAPGVELIDTPQFPAAYRSEAAAGRAFLVALRDEQELDWTYISPSALFEPGERTGQFRIGTDALLSDSAGNSRITMEDFAIAAADEIEAPNHSRQRFTVGY
ncbi:NAD(P)-dependent oxidoreductase [Delftia acidovorans]|uniref:NAD(P)-dependent oxidoreductase n=1 Tax=Delftia acidovorans TaxID=80866 RepID=A0AAJ2R7H1_DELAC|nr:NAD(P)-dependent oxidoreductase [Delftia acidovorans]MDX4956557.1 NAD(P)-dependent oxidoreductase [Delftia acidovorans]